ncbi:unnamed protein product [Urochloa humidicola]
MEVMAVAWGSATLIRCKQPIRGKQEGLEYPGSQLGASAGPVTTPATVAAAASPWRGGRRVGIVGGTCQRRRRQVLGGLTWAARLSKKNYETTTRRRKCQKLMGVTILNQSIVYYPSGSILF